MFKHITIQTEDNKYSISALINKNGDYVMPSFNIKENTDNQEIWDNDTYLIEELYPKLVQYKESTERIFELLDIEVIPESDILDILELFEEAFKIGVLKRKEI